MSCLVSVIIPAYNSEKYIKRCVLGALKCNQLELEVIVINDGSTDATECIVNEMAKQDKRIKFFSQGNKGVSSARNIGLSQAQGKYVVFSDSDDMLDGESLYKLVEQAEEAKADVVVFGRINHYPDGSISELIPKEDRINVKDDYEYAFKRTILNQSGYGWSSCNKIYKREIITNNKIQFINYKEVNSEDRIFNLAYFMKTNTVVFSDACVFHNYIRKDSLSHSKRFEFSVDRNVKSFDMVCDLISELPKQNYFKLMRYYFLSFLINVFVVETNINKLNFREVTSHFEKAIKEFFNILEKRNEKAEFANQKKAVTPENGFKYRILNCLLNHRLYKIMEILLFIYTRKMIYV